MSREEQCCCLSVGRMVRTYNERTVQRVEYRRGLTAHEKGRVGGHENILVPYTIRDMKGKGSRYTINDSRPIALFEITAAYPSYCLGNGRRTAKMLLSDRSLTRDVLRRPLPFSVDLDHFPCSVHDTPEKCFHQNEYPFWIW